MGAIDTTYTFTATDTITSTKMNDIIDQTTFTNDAVFDTTLAVAAGKLKVNAQGITSNELSSSCVTNSKLSTAAGEIGAEWQSYTPIFTFQGTGPTSGNAVITGKYIKIGKVVNYRISYILGSTTSFTGLTAMFASLPVAVNSSYANYDPVGIITFVFLNGSATGTAIMSGAVINLMPHYVEGTIVRQLTLQTSTFPFTASNQSKILVSGCYEAN